MQSDFAERCEISSAYLSDIERGRRNPPSDEVILAWARLLDPADADEIGPELIDLAARDRKRADAVTEAETEPAGMVWQATPSKQSGSSGSGQKSETPFLDHFGVDLVELARDGRLDSAPERVWEFREIACAIACRQRNSVVLTCDIGAEVYRLAQGLACEIAEGRVPESLTGKRLLTLDGIQAGVKYRGQFEERLKAVVDESAKAGDVILYFHSLADVVDLEGNARGSFFRPALEEGRVQMLTGAMAQEMDYCRKVNAGLVDCFRMVPVRPLEREGVLRGLYAVRDRYGAHHRVAYSDGALVTIVDAVEGGDHLGFWQRALDLLDEVGARIEDQEVTVGDVDRVIGNREQVI